MGVWTHRYAERSRRVNSLLVALQIERYSMSRIRLAVSKRPRSGGAIQGLPMVTYSGAQMLARSSRTGPCDARAALWPSDRDGGVQWQT
jgi:hypothetical protein